MYAIPKAYIKAHKAIKTLTDWRKRRAANPNNYVLGDYDNVKPNVKQVSLVNVAVENVVRAICDPTNFTPYAYEQASVLQAYDAANHYVQIGWMTAKNRIPHQDGRVRSLLAARGVHSQHLLQDCLNAFITTEQGSAPLAFSNEVDLERNPHRVPILMSLESLYTVVEMHLGVGSTGGYLIAQNAILRQRAQVNA